VSDDCRLETRDFRYVPYIAAEAELEIVLDS
jgi:hypothetical protein